MSTRRARCLSATTLALVVVPSGCSRSERHAEQRPTAHTASATASRSPAPRDDARATNAPLGLEKIPTIQQAIPIGHTSLVYRLDLEGSGRAALKPASKRGPRRYRAEVAAYRLAIALGIEAVPPAFGVELDAKSFRRALGPKGKALFDAEVIVEDGTFLGAWIPWIEGLEFAPLEKKSERAKWEPWLADASIPADDRARAKAIATLVVFDGLTGNWDRWSGANVGVDPKTDHLLFVDNDAAFFVPLPKEPFEPQARLLGLIQRYPKATIERLRSLDERGLTRALGKGPDGAPLLSGGELRGLVERRKAILERVAQLEKERGTASTLYFD